MIESNGEDGEEFVEAEEGGNNRVNVEKENAIEEYGFFYRKLCPSYNKNQIKLLGKRIGDLDWQWKNL